MTYQYGTRLPNPNELIEGFAFVRSSGGRVVKQGEPLEIQDCTLRSMAIATGFAYNEIVEMLGSNFLSLPDRHGRCHDFLRSLGFDYCTFGNTKSGSPVKRDLAWLKLSKDKTYILHTMTHYAAFKKGVCYDMFDSRITYRNRWDYTRGCYVMRHNRIKMRGYYTLREA